MNEEALQQLYTLAQGEGYSRSFDDFKVLMNSNEDALNNMYTVSQGEGYKNSIDDFKVLVGFGAQSDIAQEETITEDPLKKKEDTESVSADGLSESPKTDFLDFTQMASSPMLEQAQQEEMLQQKEQGVEFSESPKFLEYQIDELEEKLGETLKKDVPATPKEREVKYDRFGDVMYDSAIGDELAIAATQVSNAFDAEPIQEEIKDLQLKLDGTKAGFRAQPSFKEVYQEAYDPETKTLDKQKLTEMGVEIPILFNNDFFQGMMGSNFSEARDLYNGYVEDYYDSKKEAAGYVYVNGEFVDPESPMPGYGFDAAMDAIKFGGIVSKEEEESVGRLNNMFNQYGFRFSQSGAKDNLTAVGPDGKQLKFFGEEELPLDNWTSATDKKYGAELKRVMANAYEAAEFTDEEMFKQAMTKPSDPTAIKNEAVAGIATRASSWSKQATSRIKKDAKRLKDLLVLKNSQEILVDGARKEADEIKQRDFKDGLWSSYEAEAEYNKLIKEANDIAEVYKATHNAASRMDANLKSDVNQLTRYEGDRAMMMADMWDLNNAPALIAQSIGEGAGGLVSGVYGIADFAFSNMINLATGYDETSVGYQTDEMQRERKASVSKQLREGLGSLATGGAITDAKTSAETIASIKSKSYLSAGGTLGILMSVSESIPAMVSGMGAFGFAAFQMDGLANEMNKMPEFKNISENEKMLVLAPIATVSGVLENFGFRNAINKSSLIGRLTVGALKKFGAQTAKEGTKRTFKEIVERSVMNKISKGALLTASGAAAEMETEAAQQFSETWMKEIYDLVKGQDFYKQSIDISKGEFMNMEFAKEIAKAAYAGMIGGAVIGAPSAYAGAVKNNSIVEISDAAFNLFTMTTTPESVERTLAVQRAAYNAMVGVETNPETGQKFTQKEVDDTLLQYEYLLGQKNEINSNWDAKSQKQVLALLMEKKNLEQSIEGLDKNTTKDQQREIEILKEDIEVISSAANKNYEQVLKKEYEKAKEEGFTGTIEAFKFRQSVEKAAEEKGRDRRDKDAPVAEEVMSQEEVDELWSKESQENRIELEIEAEEQLEKEDSQRRDMLRNMGRRTEKKLITSEKIKARAKELFVKKIKEDSSKKKAPVVEEAPVTEEQPTVPQEVLETEPITKITNDLVTKEKKGELTQEETDGVLLGIMEKIEAENAKRKSPLSPEQAQKKLGKMQQRVFEGNKQRYLELSGVMPAAQEQVVEEAPVVEQVTEEAIKEAPKRKTRKKKPVVKETPVKEEPKKAPKKSTKKKAPKKQEAKISEEVQKEIKRAEGTRDSIVGPLKTKLDRTRGFEQKEEIRYEIRQVKKRYNNIITELKEGKRAQFQLESETTSEQTKQKLEDETVKLLEDVTQENNGEISEDPFTAEQPAPGAEIITIEVKENSELAKKVKKMGLGDLVGKKINLVMADQLKVDKKRMGGPFFPLIDKLFGKVAWASIDKGAASRIINGAIKSDYTVVFNMSSDGIYSNSIMGETLIELIPTEKRDEAFKLIKENILQSKSKSLKKAQGVMKVSESLEDFFKQLQDLDVDTRAAVITKLLPSKKVDTVQTEVGKFLIENNISLEGLVEANAEDFAANLPTGAMTMVLEVTDKAGNKITEETKDEAFITPEQQKEEGLPQHPNYPMYIRGKAVGILTETTPFWNMIKDVGEKINQKIEGIIQRRQGFREDLTQEEKNTVDNLKYGVALKGKDSITEAKRVAKVIRDANAKNIGGPIGKVLKDNMDLIINESSIVKIREVFQDSQNIFAKYVNTTSALARKEAMRSAEMSASRAQEVSSPEASRYEKFVSVLKRSFPSVEVVTTQAEFDTLLKETGAKQLTTKGQKVYGAVYQGKLYLNPSLENYNTPIHEFGHVWMNVAKESNPELYKKGLSLVKGSKYEQDVLNNKAYQKVIKQMRKDGASEQEVNDYIQEEALATAIGDKGESFVNASRNKSFKDWLSTLYGFVRKLTGISKYTSKQLEDITLDEFTQAVAVDLLSGRQLFEGAEITDMGDALQLMAEKGVDLDAAMNESINQMVDKGFKAAEIKGVLQQMGYKARAINDALVVKIDADMKLPNDFANIDGGVREGETMFRSVMQKLKEFAAPKLVKRSIKEQYKEAKKDGYEGTIKEYTEEQNNKKVEILKEANPALAILTNEEILERYPNIQNEVVEKQQRSRAEIRAKAIELLEAEAAFQAQDNLTQLKLIESLDRTMKTRSNKEVQKKISAIKQALKGVREGVKDLQAAKKRIKNLIREELLPIGVTTAEANKLIRTIEKATKETYESSVAEVMQVVDRQISRKRKSLINEMLKLAKQKSKVKNKRARTSPEAARFFKQATVILNALSKNNTKKLEAIEEQLRKKETEINEIIDKINDGAKVTAEQQELVALAQAFDILGSLNKQDLSETQDALNLMKSELESGMESLRTRRAARKAIYDRLREEANESIKAGYEFLFDENGKPLNPGEVTNKIQQIEREIFKGKELVKNMRDYYKLALKPNLKFFANYLKHLGTITNGLDRKGDFFKKNIYDRLNNMEESYLQGYFNSIDLLSSELEAIGIEGGYDGLSRVINDSLVKNQIKTISGIKIDLDGVSQNVSLTKGEAMRIYALSKNAEQRKRLEKQGFTPAKMQQIEEFLGEQLVQATDRVVDFLAEHYEGVNQVYESVNDVSLPYIENYFPTKTQIKSAAAKEELESLEPNMNSGNVFGVFSAQFASALKERSSEDAIQIKSDMGELDFSSVLEQHLRSTERFKAYAQGTKEINVIINSTDSVTTLLKATNLKSTLTNGIMYAINPDAIKQYYELKNPRIAALQRKFVGVTLALKFIQLPKQASSFVNAFADYQLRKDNRIPGVDTALDIIGFGLDTAYTILTLRSTFKEAMKSASFRNRIRESFKTADLLGLEAGIGSAQRTKKTKLGRALRKAKVVANSPTLVGDVMGVMGYMSAQRANKRNGMSEQEAIEKFNAYNETQQTRRPTEKVGLQTSDNVLIRSFTLFGSTFYLQLNKIMQAVTNIRRDGANSLKLAGKKEFKDAYKAAPTNKDYRELFLNLAGANFLFTSIANAFKYNPFDWLFGDDDDEITEEEMERIKKAQNALKRGKEVSDEDMKLIERYQFQLDKNAVIKQYKESLYGVNQLYNLPLIGPTSRMIVDYAFWDDPNVLSSNRFRQIDPLYELTKDIIGDVEFNPDKKLSERITPLISFSMGIPVEKPLALVDRIQSMYGGDEMYREGYEELNDKGERKFKGTLEEYKAKQMEENMYELMGISYSYRPGSGKDWTKKKMTITIDPKKEGEEEESSSKPRTRRKRTRRKKRKR
jgi:hypothetical protein